MKKFNIIKTQRFTGPYAFFEQADPVNVGEAPRCPSCGGYIGMLEWLPPYRIILGKGTKTVMPGDLIFGTHEDFIASRRFKDAWEKAGLKGITEWRLVEILGPRTFNMDYFLPRFNPPMAQPDYSKIDIIWGKSGPSKCKVCFSELKEAFRGLYLIEETIPDDDLFKMIGSPDIFATERFKTMIEKEGLLNVNLIPAKDFVWDPLYKLR